MESQSTPLPFRRYRAPREDGTALLDPVRSVALNMIKDGWNVASQRELCFCGVSWASLRASGRMQLLELAQVHTSKYALGLTNRLDEAASEQIRIVMSGHQPELYHPGVWFKNFLLSQLAGESQAIGVNVIIDNDLSRQSSIKVPVKQADNTIQNEVLQFDNASAPVPWEMRTVLSRDVWNAFPQALRSKLMSADSLVATELWNQANESLERQPNMGLAISEARHRLELQFGLNTLEVPLSQLSSSPAFAIFAMEICGNIDRFRSVYNEQLQIYRVAHRIRNHAHPVPELAVDGEWIESPFWIYSGEHTTRLPAWVRLTETEVILSDRQHHELRFDRSFGSTTSECRQVLEPNGHPYFRTWQTYSMQGICIRPRALITTMYMRMLLSDLFIHGIGGGKYDQLMESIVAAYWQVEIAPMVVATATVHLPHASRTLPSIDAASALSAEQERLRRLQYHADEVLGAEHLEMKRLQADKQQLLENIPPRGEKWRWHREMARVTQQIKSLAAEEIEVSKRRIEELQVLCRQQAVEDSREFSFCLFPKEYLMATLDRLAKSSLPAEGNAS